MGKLNQIVSIVLLACFAIAVASPARLERLKPSKSILLARQELAEDVPAQTPYPPSGIKPAIPFNLPTDEKLVAPANYYLPPLMAAANFNAIPAEVYGPPAKTYGPPEVDVKVDVEEVDSDKPEQSDEQPQEENPEEEKPEEEEPQEEKPEEKPEEQPEEEQASETTSKTVQPEEDDEVVDVEPEESQQESTQPEDSPVSDADSDSEPEAEEDIIELEPVAVEEPVSNALPERLVLARVNSRKSAKLRSASSRSAKLMSPKSRSAKLRSLKSRSAKLQLSPVVPIRRQALTAQPLYLIGGKLYSGRLIRL